MKKINWTISIIVLIANSLFAQWTTQNSSTTNDLTGVDFINSNIGWAVGTSGKIIFTTNGGSVWAAQTSGVANQLNSVSFAGSLNGIVVGGGGKILLTSDGGAIWQTMNSGIASDLYGVFSISTTTAIAVGDNGKILKTIDGGYNWTSKPSGTTDILWSVFFTDANTGWAVGGHFVNGTSKILKTINGGESWTAQTSPTTQWLYSVSFSDSQHGWAVGPNGTIVATADGGANWALQPSGEVNEWFYGCGLVSGTNVWVGGSGGLIKATTNGGTSWSTQASGITSGLRSFSFIDANNGWAVGDGGKVLKYSPLPSGTITVTSPNGGENWRIGTSQNITWASNGVANVKIEYTVDNGANWNTITNSVASAPASYSWLISNAPSTNCKIRISDAADATVNDLSNNVFTIYQPSVTVTAPNGGENWKIGTNENITWTSNGVANVKIEYTVDNGTNWNTITNSVASAPASYGWLIPNTTSTNCKVKISDAADATVNDLSNNVFTIYDKTITVTSPNGGENWEIGTNQNITWNSSGVANVMLEYSINNGTNWSTIIAGTPATPGTYNWPIPNTPTTQGLVRITDVADGTINDVSNANFTIPAPTITVTSPNGGERWNIGLQKNITWNSTSVVNVKIEYSTNMGSSWNTIINSTAAINRTYPWTIPNTPTVYGLVRITDVSNGTVSDQSNSIFSIPKVTLTAPNGGELLQIGSNYNITWTSVGVTNVWLRYRTGNMQAGNWTTIGTTSANIGNYNWAVPNTASTNCLVQIIGDNDQSLFDQSNAGFTIAQPTINLTSPNGGERWLSGTDHNVTWTSTGLTNVKLEYTTNNGANWNIMAANIGVGEGSYFYNWEVPNTPAANCKVRVSDANNATINDASDNLFSIVSLNLTSPLGGEDWLVGSNHNITWTSSGIENVLLQYRTSPQSQWTDISTVNGATGNFNWTIPNTPSTSAVIQILDSNDPTIFVQSGNFTITPLPPITITSPNGGENWIYDTNHNITWQTSLTGNLQISFTTNNGTSWFPIATVDASAGSYDWKIRNANSSTNCRIKITNAGNSVSDESDANFTISSFFVTSPNGGESWIAGTIQNITWDYALANFNNVKIEFSTNNGTSWFTLENSWPIANKSYPWSVTNTVSNQCIVRISNSADPNYNDVSNNFYSILPPRSVALTSPNGGENWKVGSQQNITWVSTSINNVKLEYTKNNGATWIHIIASTPAAGGIYNWIVPNPISNECKIRISDASNSALNDLSNNTFSIYQSAIIVVSPNGGENFVTGVIHKIRWTKEFITNVRIEFSTNNGTTWTELANNYASNSNEFDWTIPNLNSTSSKIRISDQTDAGINDQSNAVFTISNKGIVVLNPDGGGKWQVGKVNEIKWYSNNIQNVKISYSLNNGANWSPISLSTPASAKKIQWPVVDNPSTNFIVKIKDVSSTTEDVSNSVSTIAKLKLDQPNGGEHCAAALNYKIKWSGANVEKVKLEYSNDAGNSWVLIANMIPADPAEYNWLIPAAAVTENAKVRVSDALADSVLDESDNIFRITDQQTITLLSPTGGERWIAGNTYIISWSSTNVENVMVEYSADGGSNWTQLAVSLSANQENYEWHTPTQNSFNYKVRITNPQLPEINVESNIFSIIDIPSISFTSILNTNTRLIGGSNFEINWISAGVQNVKIVYTRNANSSNSTWTDIRSSINAAEGNFLWEVPMVTSQNCRIKIMDPTDSDIFAESNVFEIKEFGIHLLTPNGGENLQAKSRFPIMWNSKPTIQKVNISYKLGAKGMLSIVQNYNASEEGYLWDVPQIFSLNCKIIISDAANAANADTSDAVFTITEEINNKWIELNSFPNVSAIYFKDANNGFTVGAGLKRTNDGGISWSEITGIPSTAQLNAISFNSNTGFVVGTSGSIYRTLDGGNIWTLCNTGLNLANVSLSAVSCQGSVCFVGGGGTIIKTTNRGDSWSIQNSGTIGAIYSVFFLNSNLGWACGDYGIILKTTDGGISWTNQNVPALYLSSIFFTSPSNGFVCGYGYLGKTDDGGQTWNYYSLDESLGYTPSSFQKIYFNNNSGWITCKNYQGFDTKNIVLKTTDNGNHWETDLQVLDQDLNPIFCLNPTLGWLSGSKSYKYGNGYIKIISPNGGEKYNAGDNIQLKWNSDARNIQNVTIAYRKADSQEEHILFENIPNTGTKTFSTALLNCRECILKVSARPNISDESDTSFTISRVSLSSGYIQKGSPENRTFNDISISGANVYLNGDKVFKSTDKGNQWHEILTDIGIPSNELYTKYAFDDQNLWVAQKTGSTGWKYKKNQDAGSNWQESYIHTVPTHGLGMCSLGWPTQVQPEVTRMSFQPFKRNNNISMIAEYNVNDRVCVPSYSYGQVHYNAEYGNYKRELIILSLDQGQTWNIIDRPFKYIHFVTNSIMYAITSYGALYRSGGGTDWNQNLDLGQQKINAVYFTDYYKGFVVGNNGLIYKTINGGSSWFQQTSNTTATLNSVYFPNYQTGYAVGDGVILKTTNGGTNWIVQERDLGVNLTCVKFVDANEGWILGAEGTILYTSTGGELPHVSKEGITINVLPKEFYLSQNHPNPFNPSTTISYDLPTNSRVRISIYNILGEVVEELINGVQTAGYYKKLWNGNKLTSGVYLLRIEAESLERSERFVKSIKMLMVK